MLGAPFFGGDYFGGSYYGPPESAPPVTGTAGGYFGGPFFGKPYMAGTYFGAGGSSSNLFTVAVGGAVGLVGNLAMGIVVASISFAGSILITSPARRFWRRVRMFSFISERGRSPDHKKEP